MNLNLLESLLGNLDMSKKQNDVRLNVSVNTNVKIDAPIAKLADMMIIVPDAEMAAKFFSLVQVEADRKVDAEPESPL